MTRRVAVTGIGVLSALGCSSAGLFSALKEGKSALVRKPEFEEIKGLKTRLAAPLPLDTELCELDNKLMRSSGKVARYAISATEAALKQSGLLGDKVLSDGRTGIAYGSGFGSYDGLRECAKFMSANSVRGMSAGVYHKSMSHTCAAHIAIAYGIRGRMLCTSTACTSGSQAVGFGYENIKSSAQDIMICGGAEELFPAIVGMFDVLCACSIKNDNPQDAVKPFDKNRDGMAVGEGACTLILEEFEHARARGAEILAEVSGFATNCDGLHITNPNPDSIMACFAAALGSSGTDKVGYVNAHATGTVIGDRAEAQAMQRVYGDSTAVSSIKGQLGHALGACGAIESAITIECLRNGYLLPTMNLLEVDPDCQGIRHLLKAEESQIEFAANNTVAFGGVNTSLVFRRAG